MRKKYFKTEKGNYNYIPSDTVTEEDIKKLLSKRKLYGTGYISTPISFDIETTTFYSKKYDRFLATMYIWQLGIDKNTIIGRTWDEFIRIIDLINDALDPDTETALCWIQNFSFEFQFIKARLKWNTNSKTGYPDLFAKTDRNILYAKYKNIEFRDSLALTSMGLKSYKDNFKLDIGKLDGDLDYSLYRHFDSYVSNEELAYCINDVQVLNEWVKKYINKYYLDNDVTIPLTSTGIVRAEVKAEFNKLPKEERKRIASRIRNAQPSREMYIDFRNYLFRGGLVHANTSLCNYLYDEPFTSLDLKSAHPAQMLKYKFPYKFFRRNVKYFESALNQARSGEYGFYGIFKFKNIRCKGWHSLESCSKLVSYTNDATFDNGRLTYASEIEVCLNEIDYFNYEDIYTWDSYECIKLYISKLEPLPDYLRKIVCKYFVLKSTMEKDTLEYDLSKRKLNSCFGFLSTSLPTQSIIYDEDLNVLKPGGKMKTYDELTRYLIFLPQWSIWVAAYTRRSIVRSIVEGSNYGYKTDAGGIDSIYYDTDSNKILHYEIHKPWFDAFNNEQMELNRNMNTYGYDPKYFERIGCFEEEYIGERFKVLGAKRYLVQKDDGTIKATVAGMVRGTLEKYCKDKYGDEWDTKIWDEFTDELTLDKEYSEKQTTVYTDYPFTDTLTDYKGVTREVNESSCVGIINIPFTMDVQEEFIKRIEAMRQERERMVFKGVL